MYERILAARSQENGKWQLGGTHRSEITVFLFRHVFDCFLSVWRMTICRSPPRAMAPCSYWSQHQLRYTRILGYFLLVASGIENVEIKKRNEDTRAFRRNHLEDGSQILKEAKNNDKKNDRNTPRTSTLREGEMTALCDINWSEAAAACLNTPQYFHFPRHGEWQYVPAPAPAPCLYSSQHPNWILNAQ